MWFAALSVFAVSALHLTHHTGNESWMVELVGHHASIPLAVAILYQDYRFALADIFLKRALSLVLLVAVAFGLYLGVVSRLLEMRDADGSLEPLAVGAMLGVWVLMALAYPTLRSAASWFVDTVVLHRADYEDVRAAVAREIAPLDEPEAILEHACHRLGPALAARSIVWRVDEPGQADREGTIEGGETSRLVRPAPADRGDDGALVTLTVPTAETPQYAIDIGGLTGGRRLLSDDVAMLEAVANLVARRIDAVRVSHQRYAHDLREQEISKLATEAELRAIRAQINPHFLFNALTTIGYLIQTSPERAFDTLMRLTGLLRAVLKRSEGEFSTLGEELDLVESYLAIERARLEERLDVEIDVPDELRGARIPMLVVQPLVENAIKHGIAPSRAGGKVTVRARIEAGEGSGDQLRLIVEDSGLGVSEAILEAGRKQGIGLASVQRRLAGHFGDEASVSIASAVGAGTTVEVRLPVRADRIGADTCSRGDGRRRTLTPKVRVVVADDERPARSFLLSMLRTFDDVEIIGEASTGTEAVEVIERERPDLALLDFQMPEVDGLGVMRLLRKDRMPLVAFVTAYDEYAVRAFELNAVDYLLKPVDRQRLRETINRAQERLERAELRFEDNERVRAAAASYDESVRPQWLDRIPVRHRGEIVLVPVENLASIVADGELLHLATVSGERFTLSHRLKDLELRLPPGRFVRLGRGTLVHVDRIATISPMPGGTYVVTLTDGTPFNVSRLQSRVLRDRLLKL